MKQCENCKKQLKWGEDFIRDGRTLCWECFATIKTETADKNHPSLQDDSYCTADAAINNIILDQAKALIEAERIVADDSKNNLNSQKSKSYKINFLPIFIFLFFGLLPPILLAGASSSGNSESVTTESYTSTTSNYAELSLPGTGDVIISTPIPRSSEITIKNSTSNCFVKLKDSELNDAFGFFVRSGDTVTVDVPPGNYYVYFAYGDAWYGLKYLFGNDTQCSKDGTLENFTDYSYTYTLYGVSHGNFNPKDISIEEF